MEYANSQLQENPVKAKQYFNRDANGIPLEFLTCAYRHAGFLRLKIVCVSVASPELEFLTFFRLRVVSPPYQEGPAVSPHGRQFANNCGYLAVI